jgi:hypothetical protein
MSEGDDAVNERLPRLWPWAAMLFVMLGIAGAAAAQVAAQPGQTAPGTAVNTDPGRTIHFPPPELKPGIPTVWLAGDFSAKGEAIAAYRAN